MGEFDNFPLQTEVLDERVRATGGSLLRSWYKLIPIYRRTPLGRCFVARNRPERVISGDVRSVVVTQAWGSGSDAGMWHLSWPLAENDC